MRIKWLNVYLKHLKQCLAHDKPLVSVSYYYLISSISCGQLISWAVGSPPALFILKWGPSLFSHSLSRVAGVHVCVSLICVAPAPGLEDSSHDSPRAKPGGRHACPSQALPGLLPQVARISTVVLVCFTLLFRLLTGVPVTWARLCVTCS